AEAARTGLIGVGAYVAETPELPFSLGAIYRQLTHGDPRARFPEEVKGRAAAGRPLSYGCVSAISDFCSASENTFASIKQTITARMNLWLNPRVCAATDVSDFDLRDLRERRMSLYLGVSPDNLARVAPLYNLLLQQLVDLNTRERPTADRHAIQVLDRKSTRLNSSHSQISYAVFCLKKKNHIKLPPAPDGRRQPARRPPSGCHRGLPVPGRRRRNADPHARPPGRPRGRHHPHAPRRP